MFVHKNVEHVSSLSSSFYCLEAWRKKVKVKHTGCICIFFNTFTNFNVSLIMENEEFHRVSLFLVTDQLTKNILEYLI